MEDKKVPRYRIKLYRYIHANGFAEEEIHSNFYPSRVGGFAVELNTLILHTDGGNICKIL